MDGDTTVGSGGKSAKDCDEEAILSASELAAGGAETRRATRDNRSPREKIDDVASFFFTK